MRSVPCDKTFFIYIEKSEKNHFFSYLFGLNWLNWF